MNNEIRTGDVIDERYRIIKMLGEGGMALVYEAFDMIIKKNVAVKIIKEETMKNPLNLTRFEREARAAASLSSPNIVRVINLGTHERRPFMVNELVTGQTLKDALEKRGKYGFFEAVEIMYWLTSAVMDAHRHGVIHRDIKPQNIFITPEGTVKLGDFGIATFQNTNARLTRSEVVVGSVHYLAPEIYKGGQATYQSDIYALGVTFFELITGRVPFDDESAYSVAWKHANDKFPSPKKYNSKTPKIIEKIIFKACAKDVSKRYQTAFDMRKDLDRLRRDPSLIKKVSLFERLFSRKK